MGSQRASLLSAILVAPVAEERPLAVALAFRLVGVKAHDQRSDEASKEHGGRPLFGRVHARRIQSAVGGLVNIVWRLRRRRSESTPSSICCNAAYSKFMLHRTMAQHGGHARIECIAPSGMRAARANCDFIESQFFSN